MQSLDKVIKSISDISKSEKNPNEAATKEWLIRPFFESLGWDFSNPYEIVPEDDDEAGRRTDYCFYIKDKPKLLLEAKSLKNMLTDNKMIIQKLNYCSNRDIPLLILTNGNNYKIYFSELKGIGKEKLLLEFTLSEKIDEEVILMLSKKSFEQNILLKYARDISLYSTVKKAVEKMIQTDDKRLIKVVNDKIKELLGHKFGDDDVIKALKQFSLIINSDTYENSIAIEDEIISNGKIYTISDQFRNGRWIESEKNYQKLITHLKKTNITFQENPTKRYISLLKESKSFCQICGLRSGLKFWVNLDINDLSEEEVLKVRDVSKIGHWGMGNVEYMLLNDTDLSWSASLILKSYQKN